DGGDTTNDAAVSVADGSGGDPLLDAAAVGHHQRQLLADDLFAAAHGAGERPFVHRQRAAVALEAPVRAGAEHVGEVLVAGVAVHGGGGGVHADVGAVGVAVNHADGERADHRFEPAAL